MRAFLRVSAENNTSTEHLPGCLVGCCAAMSVGSVPGVEERVRAVLAATETHLRERFTREEAAGTLATSPSPAARATLLLDLMDAQAIRARAGASRDDLLSGLDARADAALASAITK